MEKGNSPVKNNKLSRKDRKRQREEKLREYGIELPDIPGLPVEVIPLHVEAVKSTAKVFGKNGSHYKEVLKFAEPYEGQKEAATGHNNTPLLEHLMRRVEAQSSPENSLSEEQIRMRKELFQKHQSGSQAWLNSIHRAVKDRRSSDGRVPVAALQHLFEVGLDHKRWSIRRATLHLAGRLLEKSADCRAWWLQTDEDCDHGAVAGDKIDVLVWMDHILVDEDNHAESNSSSKESQQLWQREAYDLLQHLDAKGYSGLYSTLSVALQRFEQRCPPALLSQTNAPKQDEGAVTLPGTRSMASLRQLRDVAMARWDATNKNVQKLLSKAQDCFDILVPRLVDDDANMRASKTEGSGENPSVTNKTVDDGDEDIDWEDGFEEDDDDENHDLGSSVEEHAQAVERTLAAMQTAAGGLSERGLQVSLFGDAAKNETTTAPWAAVSPDNEQAKTARSNLDRILKLLATKYMPRLSVWSEALTVADGLKNKTAESLVQMNADEQRRRRIVSQSCLDVKSQIARVLQSGRRLGLEVKAAVRAEHHIRPVVAVSSSDTIGLRKNERLATNLTKRRRLVGARADRFGQRSAKIQIKFAKR